MSMSQNDNLKNQLQSMFSDFEAETSHDSWDRLEKALNASRSVLPLWQNRAWRAVTTVAAIGILLLGSVLFMKLHQPIQENNHQASSYQPNEAFLDEKPAREAAQVNTGILKSENLLATTIKPKKETSGKTPFTQEIYESLYKNDIEVEEIKMITTNEPRSYKNDVIPSLVEEENKLNKEEIERLIREFERAGDISLFEGAEIPAKDKSSNRMLAINTRSGMTQAQTVVNKPMTLRSATVVDGNDEYFANVDKSKLSATYDNAINNVKKVSDNVSELQHAQPVSFGLTFSKEIARNLFIESGIVYTYLSSRVSNRSTDFRNNEQQRFHYLGVPLNLNYNFVSIGKFDLYTSLGGMIEKDIYGEFDTSGISVGPDMGTASEGRRVMRIKQKNPQVSIHTGVGISYPLYKGINVYGQIGGAYYFDAGNYEFKTIYNDKKIMLDLNAGIRFDF